MFSKSGYNDNLKELIKAKKADKSVVSIIKGNLDIQADAKSAIRKSEKEIKVLTVASENKQNLKTQTSLYNFKEYMGIRKELKEINKQIKKMNEEVKQYNKKMEIAESENSKLEEEIDNQYKIFKENEIYIKALERIDTKIVDIPEDIYTSYQDYIDEYNNSIYSVEKNSKLPKPKAEDFVGILNALKESEEKQKTKKRTRKTTKKATESK